jgi:hypothetical protein
MKTLEAVAHLAALAARGVRLVSDDEDVPDHAETPQFEIQRVGPAGSPAAVPVAGTWETHDNAPRMQLCTSAMTTALSSLEDAAQAALVGCRFRIQLHDSYTYLSPPHDRPPPGTLVFSQRSEGLVSDDVVLIPDSYFLCNWGAADPPHSRHPMFEQLLAARDHPTAGSKPRAVFAGTTTGSRNPFKNQRLALCRWAATTAEGRATTDAWIGPRIAQMPGREADVMRAAGGPDVWHRDVFRPDGVSLDEQLTFKYLILSEGNTARFDVWPWFAPKSVVLKMDGPRKSQTSDVLFWHPLVREGTHYVGVGADPASIPNSIKRVEAMADKGERIMQESSALAKELFQPKTWQTYLSTLLEVVATDVAP